MKDKIKVWFIHCDYFLKNGILKILVSLIFPSNIPNGIRKILIFRNGSLGDSICAIPAITRIREKYKDAEIILLTHSGGFKDISIGNIIHPSLVNKVINYEDIPYPSLIKQLRYERIDLFILLPQAHANFKKQLKDLLFAKYIRARYAIGFKICVTRLLPKTQAKYIKIPNVRDFLLSIIDGQKGENLRNYSFKLNILKEDEDFVKIKLSENKISDYSKTVALTIGAKRPQNRWPIEYFDEVIAFIIANKFKCIIIGGKEDSIFVNKLKTKEAIVDFTGQLSAMQSAIALRSCILHITNDTGPMHLSYAVGTFVLALFSSRDYPNLWFPPDENSVVFRNKNIFCSECFSNECSNNICMKSIRPEKVIEFLKLKLVL